MTVLSLDQLQKSFGPVRAVRSLSLDVEEGQVYGILGPNGSGKTTTLAMALGIVQPDQGSFRWFGQAPLADQRKRIGSLLESPNFYPYLNLVENLRMVCRIKGIAETEIFRVLRQVGLLERQKSRFQTLSYGMKQRLALGSVLLGDPEVLVLDEPANGLDPEGIAEVRAVVKQEADKGKTIIMASHILDEVEKVCTHVAILRQGSLLRAGEVGKLMKTETIMVLASEDMVQLRQILEAESMVSVREYGAKEVTVVLGDGVTPGQVNKKLVAAGIALEKMEVHKQSLEEQFLELVRQADQEGGMA